jgi:hypothetical protein
MFMIFVRHLTLCTALFSSCEVHHGYAPETERLLDKGQGHFQKKALEAVCLKINNQALANLARMLIQEIKNPKLKITDARAAGLQAKKDLKLWDKEEEKDGEGEEDTN